MFKTRISKELEQRWQDRIRWIGSTEFSSRETEESKAARIGRGRKDYGFFVSHYFPHLATKPTAKFQKEAAQIIKMGGNIRLLLEWARGHAKSSHASLLIPLWLYFQEVPELHFMVLVSKSQEMAIRLLSDIQAELQYNELLIHDFGPQMGGGTWADGEFVTKSGAMFVALGRGQSPRGLKNRGRRPDYIVVDDIDDDELVRNSKRVGDVLEWILTALFGTMEGGRGRFIMVGNRIGKDSVLSRFATLAGIKHTVVNMLDKKGNVSWAENYTPKEVADIKLLIGERRFQKEYMNNPITEGTVFLARQIRFGKMLPLKEYKSIISYTDPSFKSSTTNDYKFTVLLGKTPTGQYHILKAYGGQCSVSEMVAWHYEIEKWVDGKVPILYYMESNFLQDLLLDEFTTIGNAIGHHIPIRGDDRKKPDKFSRIEAMQPLFERLLMLFNEAEKESPGVLLLIDQLLMFEKGMRTHDDGPRCPGRCRFPACRQNPRNKQHLCLWPTCQPALLNPFQSPFKMFVELEEMRTVLYRYQLDEITEGDDTIALIALQTAEDEVRSYFRNGRGLAPAYDVTGIFGLIGAGRNQLLIETIKNIALWNLVRLCNVDTIYDHVKDRYDRSMAWLKDVNRGQIILDLPLITVDAGDAQQLAFRSGSRLKFNHE